MLIQLILVFLFLLNLAFFWFFVYGRKFPGYKYLGIALFLILPLISVFFDQPRFDLDYFWWYVAGYLLAATGVVLLVWARRELKEGEILVTSGPYAWLRHPQYLSCIFIFVGWWWIFAAVYSFYFGMFILGLIWIEAWLEERFLMDKFGKKFTAYRAETGMFWIK
ncbi:MAG: isoprenylcysteine carboxylmethyltransferase family protein [Candidatus Margulisiibacteriota bacterium]|jgi:protein-S-isoprenylcysteine O-methyltransferase Ste14